MQNEVQEAIMTGGNHVKRKNGRGGTGNGNQLRRIREDVRVSLRIPPRLYDMFKGCAVVSGSTVNSMACIAISEYLVNRGIDVDNQKR